MRINLAKIQKRITRRDDKVFGIINYDVGNDYPQKVTDIVNGSGVAVSCLDIFKKFVTGKGFSDASFGETILDGEHLTADKFHRKISKDFTSKGGFAVHFNFNLLGQVVSWSHIPFAHCRLAIDKNIETGKEEITKIAVYDDWSRERSKKIDKADIDYIHLFDTRPEVVMQQIIDAGGIEQYKGQVLYFGQDGELVYPLAPYDSELEDIETDGQIKLFKYRNISGSFMASHLLVTYGQFEDGGNNSAGTAPALGGVRPTTASDQESAFIAQIKEFQGAENFNRVMHIEAETPEQKPELIPFTHQNNDKLFEYHEKSTQDNIRKVFIIPTVFIEAISGSLGLSAQLKDAFTFYNRITLDEREILQEVYKFLFKDYFPAATFEITEIKFNANNLEVKDVLDVVSLNEKREMVGLPEQKNTTDTISLAQKIGVGGTQSMQSILVDTVLTRDQKAGTLKVLFGLTDEQIDLMLPVVETVTP